MINCRVVVILSTIYISFSPDLETTSASYRCKKKRVSVKLELGSWYGAGLIKKLSNTGQRKHTFFINTSFPMKNYEKNTVISTYHGLVPIVLFCCNSTF